MKDKNDVTGYTKPSVWQWEEADGSDHGGKFSSTNRPTAGIRQELTLPRGDKPLQLYSLNTPNGIKINIMLEELATLGIKEAEFDGYKINIFSGQQFGSDFVNINPNSKIPALVDTSTDDEIVVFESGSILLYLAEKFGKFIPMEQGKQRAECMNWLMWQMGSAPYLGGGFGHFYQYAPEPMEYPINRFTMETKRQLDVLDKHLATHEYMSSFGYSIADMAIFPWYGGVVIKDLYKASEFLDVQSYPNVIRWATQIAERDAVERAVDLPLIEID